MIQYPRKLVMLKPCRENSAKRTTEGITQTRAQFERFDHFARVVCIRARVVFCARVENMGGGEGGDSSNKRCFRRSIL